MALKDFLSKPASVTAYTLAQSAYIKGCHDGIQGVMDLLKACGEIVGVTWDEVEKKAHADFNEHVASKMPEANEIYLEGMQYVKAATSKKVADA